jgi:hypothetical protein
MNIGKVNGWWGIMAGIIGAIFVASAWVVRAEQSHEETRSNTEILQILTDLKKAEIEQEDAETATVLRLCIDKIITDERVCAQAQLKWDMRNARESD